MCLNISGELGATGPNGAAGPPGPAGPRGKFSFNTEALHKIEPPWRGNSPAQVCP